MLLLVDDEKAQVPEPDGLGEQRMRADDDVDLAVLQSLAHLRQLLRGDQPRGLRDLHGKAAEALGEGLEVLPRQKRRRHDHRDLFSFHDREESRSQRHFGLAEADIAANEPVHRLALGKVFGDRVDAGELIVGLLVGEARDELVIGPVGHSEHGRWPCLARGRNLDQLLRHLADALLHAGLAPLPGRAAELVQVRARLVGAVARQKLHVLDGQEKLVAARIFQLHAIVRRARRGDGLKADEAADAVIGMDHEIAGREARSLHQHVAGLFRLPASDEPVAENILLGDDGEVGRLEAAFETEQRKAHRRLVGFSRFGDIRNLLDASAAMRRDHVAEPLASTVSPARHDGSLPEPLKGADMLDDGRDQLFG